jgi:CheY-like chemotaxis protein
MNISEKHCVLIVDDDPGIRRLLATVLRRRGFQLLEACDGREGLAAMRSGKADVVVMDLMMPEVSGWDVLRERATEPALMAIPMIVVTANNSRQVIDDLLDKHVYAVVAKPFDLDVLVASVTACLAHPHAPVLAAA